MNKSAVLFVLLFTFGLVVAKIYDADPREPSVRAAAEVRPFYYDENFE